MDETGLRATIIISHLKHFTFCLMNNEGRPSNEAVEWPLCRGGAKKVQKTE